LCNYALAADETESELDVPVPIVAARDIWGGAEQKEKGGSGQEAEHEV
jgi:hypothetical protein